MFIDMLSQPDFDSYDLSSLRGGKSQNSNGKILRTRIFLVPCWEVVFSFVSKRLFWWEEFSCMSLVFPCSFDAAFPLGILPSLCILGLLYLKAV